MDLYGALYSRVLFPLYEQVLRGRDTLRHLADLEASQWLSADEVRSRQWDRLQEMLRYCEANVPYYAQAFAEAGVRADDIQTPGDLQKVPLLSKDDVRQNQDALVATPHQPAEKLVQLTTSGSSGVPIRVMLDHSAYERRIAAWIRGDRWSGWDLGVKTFCLLGARPMGATTWWKETKKKLDQFLSRHLNVTALSMSHDILVRYFRQLNRFRPEIIIGYANSLYHFARFIRTNELTPWRPRGIIVCAERIFGPQRRYIAEVFGAPVFERYGCMEFSFIAGECDSHDGMHVNSDYLYGEILDEDGRPVAPGEMGEVVVTAMNNFAMPLVRYRLGDMARWGADACPCGRGLPLLQEVMGRTVDIIYTPSGRICSGIVFPYILDEFPSIAQFQVVQETIEDIVVRLQPADGSLESKLPEIEAGLRQYLGREVGLHFEIMDHIPPSDLGKFHHIRSMVTRDIAPPVLPPAPDYRADGH